MTDKEKLDKLIAEIERGKKEVKDNISELGNSESERIGLFDKEKIYNDILSFYNSMQEEPKTDWLQELQERLNSLSKEDFEKVMAKYSRYGEEGTVDYDKLNTMLDESLSKETKESWNKRLGEEPVSEDLEDAAEDYCKSTLIGSHYIKKNTFKAGAKWHKNHLWKPADGDDLPEIDREVIALLDNGKVVYAHRPPEYWDGKNIVTGKVTRYYPKTYGKGGWNIPNVKYWLDVYLPKLED